MKYDRPVWQLMHACADALPETFRLDDVRAWFAEHYPEVGDATIRAHVVGLTEGGAKHPQFQRRSPLFRRVERGVYSPIPFDERGELPEDNPDDDATPPIRFRLVGTPAEDEALAAGDSEPDENDDAEGESEDEGTVGDTDEGGDTDEDAEVDTDEDAGVDPGDESAESADEPVDDDSRPHHVEPTGLSPAARAEASRQSDAMTQAAAARRKRRDKDDRRLRKAAKREQRRRQEAEAEHTRRALGSASTGQFDPEFEHVGPTEAPVVGPRAIEAERARQMAARLEAAQRESVAELERAREAAQQSLETERQRLASEREQLDRIAAERAELARTAQDQIEAERIRLEADRRAAERRVAEKKAAAAAEAERADEARAEAIRLQNERAEAERLIAENKAAAKAEAERVEAARAEAVRLHNERVEAERLIAESKAAAQAEAERAAAAQAEAIRWQNQRAEAEREAADREARRVAEETAAAHARAAVQAEADRAAAARTEAARLQAERLDAEREAEQERKRVSKLRKAARKERERAEAIERENMERHARRAAERQARERAEEQVREEAEQRRREEEERRREEVERQRAEEQMRQEMDRLEQEARTRFESERERDLLAFHQAELDRKAFEERQATEREERERAQLEREEEQLHITLHPMVEDSRPSDEPPKPEHVDPFDAAGLFDPDEADGQPLSREDDRFLSPGGIVIVRAPRENRRADNGDDEYAVAEPVRGRAVVEEPEPSAPPSADASSAPPSPEASSTPPSPEADVDAVAGRPSDAIVLGSIGQRLTVPAPARDAFRDIAFQRARRDAELSGSRWFVLSAEHGLLEPGEWMSPDERAMTEIAPRHRAAWATWVVARLESLVGELPGQVIQVEAPGAIAAPVVAALRVAGAETVEGHIVPAATAEVAELAEMADDVPAEQEPEVQDANLAEDVDDEDVDDDLEDDQFDDEADDDEPVDDEAGEPTPIRAVQPPSEVDDRPDAEVIPFVRAASVSEHLADPYQAIPAAAFASLPHVPGLYAWTVDHAGSRDLNRALRLPVRAGIIYVGQVGGTTRACDSGRSINDHVSRVQLHGRARASTFRMTLATSLASHLGLHTVEDPRLTEWMLEHLSISVWPTEDVSNLSHLQSSVVDELAPALNLDRRHSSEYRDRLAELGGRLA